VKTHHRIVSSSATDLSDITDGTVDLIVTSPPYPMIAMWDQVFSRQDPVVGELLQSGRGAEAFERMHLTLDGAWRECSRVLRPGGFACINIGDATRKIGDGFRLYTNHSRVTGAFEALGMQSLPAILWRKQTNAPNKFMGSGMLPSGAYVTLEHEYILVFRKGDKRTFEPHESDRRRRSAFFWEERNTWFSDIWDFKGTRQPLTGGDARKRSGAYPFELPFRLINMYSLQGDVVLDPFVGTGTTTIAAIASGRNSIGVEIDRGLTEVIDATIQDFIPRFNDRQAQRLEAHAEFVREYTQKRDRPPGYWNRAHGTAVVTKQETELTLLAVDRVERTGAGGYTVFHASLDDAPPVPAAPTDEGPASTSPAEDSPAAASPAATSPAPVQIVFPGEFSSLPPNR
jgi:modification methylase